MQSGKVHRLDRRPERRGREALRGPTKDECVPDLDPEATDDIEHNTANEIELFDLQVDLEVVVAVCFEIAQDPRSHQYSLLTHNCFFFSWTLFMAVARWRLPYTKPQSDILVQSFVEQHIVPVRNFIVTETLDFFSFLVIQLVTIFRDEALKRPAIIAGMPPIIRLTWRIPKNILQFFWKRGFNARVHLGLEENLKKHVEEMLRTRAIELAEHVLEQPEIHSLLDLELWLTGLDKIVRPAVEVEVIKRLWKSIFEAITHGFGDDLQMRAIASFQDLAARRSIGSLLGRRMRESSVEFFAVMNAALHGGLRAAHMAAEAEEDEQLRQSMVQIQKRYRDRLEERQEAVQYDMLQAYNQKMFELAGKAARDGALSSAKEVMRATHNIMKNKEGTRKRRGRDVEVREKMWNEVWVVWNDCWDRAQPPCSEKVVGILAKISDHVITTYKTVVTETLKNATVSASIQVSCAFVSSKLQAHRAIYIPCRIRAIKLELTTNHQCRNPR